MWQLPMLLLTRLLFLNDNALYYKEVQHAQKNQHVHIAIKLQHILEADDQFRCSAGLPRLDLPEHLWGV